MAETIPVAIVLLFDAKTVKRAVNMSKSQECLLRAESSSFCLGTATNLPHMPLLPIMLTPDKLAECTGLVAIIAHRTPKIRGVFTSVRSFGRSVFWMTTRTPELAEMARQVVESCARLRAGPFPTNKALTDLEEMLREKYGSHAVLECFNPHITVQRLKSAQAGFDGGEVTSPWVASALALVELNEFGQAIKVLRQFSLPQGPGKPR